MGSTLQIYLDYWKPYWLLRNSLLLYPYATNLLLFFFVISFYFLCSTFVVDYQQGAVYRILYIHVSSAWMCMCLYLGIAVLSILYLVTYNQLLVVIAKAWGLLGVLFTSITLVSGSLWGFCTWGTFWVWDARLTSVLVLFFVYLIFVYMLYRFEQSNASLKTAFIFALIGLVNIPIVKYSVDWWNTLHQQASISQSVSSIHLSMVIPVLFWVLFLVSYSFLFTILLVRLHLLSAKLRALVGFN